MTHLAAVACVAIACSGQSSTNKPTHAGQDSVTAARPQVAAPAPKATAPAPAAKPARAKGLADVGIHRSYLDTNTNPCDDFYQYACGGYIAGAQVTATAPTKSRVADLVSGQSARLAQLLQGAQAGHTDAGIAKLGAYYKSCTDEAAITAKGTAGVAPLLDAAQAVKNARTLASALAVFHKHRVWAGMTLGVAPDFRSATQLLYLDQGVLGLGSRAAYLRFGDQQKVRRDYRKHVARLLEHGGAKRAAARRDAGRVVKLETDLAQETMIRGQRRHVARMSRRTTRGELAKLAKRFDWGTYFAGLGIPDVTAIAITDLRYMRLLGKLSRGRFAEWRAYLTYHALRATPHMVGGKVRDEMTAFMTPRGHVAATPTARCTADIETHLGHLLARATTTGFTDADKRAAAGLVGGIAKHLGHNAASQSWLAEPTRKRAQAKLDATKLLVGGPTTPPADTLSIDAGNYAQNALAARSAMTARELATVGKPVARDAWIAPAHTVNVIYNWLANQITVPAGVLTLPFFDRKRSDAVNLGALALLVGNELVHAIDRGGAMFDAKGRLAGWWARDDEKAFAANAACFVKQYSAYTEAGQPVDGRRTLRENMADLAGARAAYGEHKTSAGRHSAVGGMTPDQQFFVGLAQTWCANTTDAEAKRRLGVDSHAPPRHRVNGVVANMPAFAAAFSCAAGKPMVRKNACTAW